MGVAAWLMNRGEAFGQEVGGGGDGAKDIGVSPLRCAMRLRGCGRDDVGWGDGGGSGFLRFATEWKCKKCCGWRCKVAAEWKCKDAVGGDAKLLRVEMQR